MTELTSIGLRMEDVNQQSVVDFLDQEPTKAEKIEMSKARKVPSEWLKLLCHDWVLANSHIVDATDSKLIEYKPYLKGNLSSQLLCRLSIPEQAKEFDIPDALNFWKILGIIDDFDRAYIISQIERFCILYSIRAHFSDDDLLDPVVIDETARPETSIVAVPNYIEAHPISTAFTLKDDEKIYIDSKRSIIKSDQGQPFSQKREIRQRERDAVNMRKLVHKAAKEATREEKRVKKWLLRQEREKLQETQKTAALRRAAELVRSNRVPIEITRGAAAAQAAANAAVAMMTTYQKEDIAASVKKARSAIVVSTASDLDQIVTHSKNLWTKYNAIAKEHNQKVNWITVAKELGIHVKVREKYARMHMRAINRGFDFEKYGHFRIKEHPEIFLEPLTPEQKLKIENNSQGISHPVSTISDDQVAAAVDAAINKIKTVPVPQNIAGFDNASAAATAVDAVMNINGDVNNNTVEHTDLSVADATTAALAAAPDQDCTDV